MFRPHKASAFLIGIVLTLSSVAYHIKPAFALQVQVREAKQAINCSNVNDIMDTCGAMASFSFTMNNSQYPTTLAELRQVCPRNNEGIQCLRQHVKCLKPLTKRAMLAFIDGRKKHIKKVCSDLNGPASREFTELFSCIKKHKKQKYVQAETLTIRKIEAILSDQVKDFKERFQRSCCTINSFRQRALEDLGSECGSAINAATLESSIDSVVGEAVEFACPDPKSGVCTSLKELKLSTTPINKTLTRMGTELLMVITEPEDGSQTLPPKNS